MPTIYMPDGDSFNSTGRDRQSLRSYVYLRIL